MIVQKQLSLETEIAAKSQISRGSGLVVPRYLETISEKTKVENKRKQTAREQESPSS